MNGLETLATTGDPLILPIVIGVIAVVLAALFVVLAIVARRKRK